MEGDKTCWERVGARVGDLGADGGELTSMLLELVVTICEDDVLLLELVRHILAEGRCRLLGLHVVALSVSEAVQTREDEADGSLA